MNSYMPLLRGLKVGGLTKTLDLLKKCLEQAGFETLSTLLTCAQCHSLHTARTINTIDNLVAKAWA